MNLSEAIEKIHDEFRRFRNLHRLLISYEFQQELEYREDLKELEDAIRKEDKDEIRKWIKKKGKEPEEMTMVELRRLASKLRIPYYSTYSHYELLRRVIDAKQRKVNKFINRP